MLATLLREIRLEVAPGFLVEPEALVTLRPRHGLLDDPEAAVTTSSVRAGGYDPARITAGGVTAEVARLAAQAALTFAEELRILLELGLAEPDPWLTWAAGPARSPGGSAAACPRLPVLGLDSSLTMISRAAPARPAASPACR